MPLIADTHVHLYPCHDAGTLLDGVVDRLGVLAPGCERAIFLTERKECNWFGSAAQGELPGGWSADASYAPAALRLKRLADEAILWVFAGRQINARERLEILALATDARFDEGVPVRELIAQVNAIGGVPVLPWSPGKWMFSRGALVRRLLAELPPQSFRLGDSYLRCLGWPRPLPMSVAALAGNAPLAGTDPLPFPGEESVAGAYASMFTEDLDPQKPLDSARVLLRTKDCEPRGHRGSPWSMLARLYRLRSLRV